MKDELFLRGAQVPMTKEAVRALALAKLELHRARHLIDIGAGT
ncbi:TPA: cobalt-precorrin-6Y C(15)-methyltransferase, partial [Klebsiella pneumoniae]